MKAGTTFTPASVPQSLLPHLCKTIRYLNLSSTLSFLFFFSSLLTAIHQSRLPNSNLDCRALRRMAPFSDGHPSCFRVSCALRNRFYVLLAASSFFQNSRFQNSAVKQESRNKSPELRTSLKAIPMDISPDPGKVSFHYNTLHTHNVEPKFQTRM